MNVNDTKQCTNDDNSFSCFNFNNNKNSYPYSSNNLARLAVSSDDPESIKSPYEVHFSKFHYGEFEGRIDPKTAAFKLNDAFWLSDEPLTKHNKRSYQRAQHNINNHAAAPDATLEHASQAIQDSGTNAK